MLPDFLLRLILNSEGYLIPCIMLSVDSLLRMIPNKDFAKHGLTVLEIDGYMSVLCQSCAAKIGCCLSCYPPESD